MSQEIPTIRSIDSQATSDLHLTTSEDSPKTPHASKEHNEMKWKGSRSNKRKDNASAKTRTRKKVTSKRASSRASRTPAPSSKAGTSVAGEEVNFISTASQKSESSGAKSKPTSNKHPVSTALQSTRSPAARSAQDTAKSVAAPRGVQKQSQPVDTSKKQAPQPETSPAVTPKKKRSKVKKIKLKAEEPAVELKDAKEKVEKIDNEKKVIKKKMSSK